jgi:hypothetical protein
MAKYLVGSVDVRGKVDFMRGSELGTVCNMSKIWVTKCVIRACEAHDAPTPKPSVRLSGIVSLSSRQQPSTSDHTQGKSWISALYPSWRLFDDSHRQLDKN